MSRHVLDVPARPGRRERRGGATRPAGVRCRRVDTQRGVGTLLVAAVMLLILVIAAVGTLLGALAVAQKQAIAAADLAALSGAAAFTENSGVCAAAGRIARANGVELVYCSVRGDSIDFVVTVHVQRTVAILPGLTPVVSASADAGRLEPVG